jgi:hypothetical protein
MNVRCDCSTSTNRRPSSLAIGPALGALALAATGLSCGGESRALVLIDLTGDSLYSSVDVALIANGGASKTFQGLTFSETVPALVGIYVSNPSGGAVEVVARVERDHCLVGQGQVTVTGVKAGGTPNKGVLLVHRVTPTSCVPSDAGAVPHRTISTTTSPWWRRATTRRSASRTPPGFGRARRSP